MVTTLAFFIVLHVFPWMDNNVTRMQEQQRIQQLESQQQQLQQQQRNLQGQYELDQWQRQQPQAQPWTERQPFGRRHDDDDEE